MSTGLLAKGPVPFWGQPHYHSYTGICHHSTNQLSPLPHNKLINMSIHARSKQLLFLNAKVGINTKNRASDRKRSYIQNAHTHTYRGIFCSLVCVTKITHFCQLIVTKSDICWLVRCRLDFGANLFGLAHTHTKQNQTKNHPTTLFLASKKTAATSFCHLLSILQWNGCHLMFLPLLF